MKSALTRRRVITILLLAVLLGAGAIGYAELLQEGSQPCGPTSPVQKADLKSVHFDAVTKFLLPANRSPNAIMVSPDGSVWFGELGSPGVGHLYPNGTLTEYRWPFTYPTGKFICSDFTDTWGIVSWNGRIWASDADRAELIGLSPSNDSFQYVKLAENSFPYTMAVSPDDHLWFTALSSPAQLGEVDPTTHAVTYFPIPAPVNSSSAYVMFQNSSLGYVLTIHPYTPVGSNLFSFDPSAATPTFVPIQAAGVTTGSAAGAIPGIGGGAATPTSIAVGEGGVWLTEHFSSDMGFFSYATKQWETYPTSTAPYVGGNVSLPYFDVWNGSALWFNEHYGNKLSFICCNRTALTEYAEADSDNGTIDNALSLAAGTGRVWFTEWSANYVGFVDTSYPVPFGLSVDGNSTVTVRQGSSAQVQLTLSDRSSAPLKWQFADTEQTGGVPTGLSFSPRPANPSAAATGQAATLTITCASTLAPGEYLALATVTDGLIYKSVYINVVVTAA